MTMSQLEDAAEQKRYDEAWVAYEAELKEARGEFNKAVEDARAVKRRATEAAYKTLRERNGKALERFHQKAQLAESE